MTPLILDGGTGSELRRRGVMLSRECWSANANLSHAELLVRIHRDYIEAGADIVTANTFATSRFVLAAAGLGERFGDVNRNAVDAARQAADESGKPVTVAATISCLPPGFDPDAYPDPDTEYRDYAELADCFACLDVGLLVLEMLQDTDHTALACRAASASGLPFWAGISCRLDQSGNALVGYDNAEQPFASILETVLRFSPSGIAVMHSPLDAIGPALGEVRRAWDGPIGAYAEITYAEDPDRQRQEIVEPEDYAAAAQEWITQGATLIGGCCGTTPDHIRALRVLAGD
ncbi:MAG TPA: homocysteine S-methyltransferase family protein [Gammaproteobacteria bacterium]|nr:homocysteine S-methyltransferase family protein [Gammaproteobacteria bacterium]